MCSVEQLNRFQLPAMAPRDAGCKRPHALTLAVCEHDAAADQRRAKKMPPQANLSADHARAMVRYVAPPVEAEPVNAVPLVARPAADFSAHAGALVSHVAPPIEAAPVNAVPMDAVAPGRAEPAWIRKLLLPRLKLRFDLPVHFIGEKVVMRTDLDGHQNRFRLPTDGVLRRLLPILSPEEVKAANLIEVEAPRPRPPKQPAIDGAAATDGEQGRGRRKKKQGKNHGGLPVHVMDMNGGIKRLQLSRWDSSRGIIIKGEGYLDFISRCSFKEKDLIEIWAFKQPLFRIFGVTMCAESPLYLVMFKRDDEQRQPLMMPPLPDLPQ